MDKYKNLYKNNTRTSPRQRNLCLRNLQENRRHQRRTEQYLEARNIGVIEQNEDAGKIENKRTAEECEARKENISNNQIANISCKANNPVWRRQQEYLKRFTEWKQTKKSSQQISTKSKEKKPFMPVGAASLSFVPKDHKQFTAPPGLKNPLIYKRTTTHKTRKSIYKVNSPPKRAKLSEEERMKIAFSMRDKAAQLTSRTKLARDKKQESSQGPIPHKTTSAAAFKNSTEKRTLNNLVCAFDNPAVSTVPRTIKSSAIAGKLAPKGAAIIKTQQTQIAKRPLPKVRPIVERITSKAGANTGAIKMPKTIPMKREGDKLKVSCKNTRLGTNMKNNQPSIIKKRNMKNSIALKKLMLEEDISEIVQTPLDFNCVNTYIGMVTSTQIKKPPATESSHASVQPYLNISEQPLQSPHKEVVEKPRVFNFMRYSLVNKSVCGQEEVQETEVTKDVVTSQVNDKQQTTSESKDIKTPEKNVVDQTATNYVSPFVTLSRGKVSRREEASKRDSIYLQLENESSLRNSTLKANFAEILKEDVAVRRTVESVRYFRQQLQDEIDRLHCLCDNWEAYKQENLQKLQEMNGDDMINVAVGQTKLLTSKKFMQFRELIDRCEARATGIGIVPDDGSENTKCINDADLEGFWAMLKLQVENLDKRFDKLTRWKVNDWNDPDALVITEKKSKPKMIKVQKNKLQISKPSSLITMVRKMQAEARKNKAQQLKEESQEADGNLTPSINSLRRPSVCKNLTPRQCSGERTPNRISVTVKNRKSFSKAATVLLLSAGKKRSSLVPEETSPNLFISPSLKQFNKNLDSFQNFIEARKSDFVGRKSLYETPPAINDGRRKTMVDSATPRAECKSILKTPGTVKSKLKNVMFNEKLRVKKFNFLINDNNENGQSEEEATNGSHGEDLATFSEDLGGDERTYSLRSRKIQLRPSSEIVIPRE
uniref:Guanylate kinase-associated protein mars n=1 Tax=Glossina austeni TaxID=7395 RepID=A0A1A9VJD8_GLOAU